MFSQSGVLCRSLPTKKRPRKRRYRAEDVFLLSTYAQSRTYEATILRRSHIAGKQVTVNHYVALDKIQVIHSTLGNKDVHKTKVMKIFLDLAPGFLKDHGGETELRVKDTDLYR